MTEVALQVKFSILDIEDENTNDEIDISWALKRILAGVMIHGRAESFYKRKIESQKQYKNKNKKQR